MPQSYRTPGKERSKISIDKSRSTERRLHEPDLNKSPSKSALKSFGNSPDRSMDKKRVSFSHDQLDFSYGAQN